MGLCGDELVYGCLVWELSIGGGMYELEEGRGGVWGKMERRKGGEWGGRGGGTIGMNGCEEGDVWDILC